MRALLSLILTLSTSLFLAGNFACSRAEPRRSSSQPSTYLAFENLVLFELDSAGDLSPNAPRLSDESLLKASVEYSPTTLNYVVDQHVAARFVMPSFYQTGVYSAASYQAILNPCALEPNLREVVTFLARKSGSLDIHSRIPMNIGKLPSCELASLMGCFLNRLRSRDWVDLKTRALQGKALREIVASLSSCSNDSSLWQTEPYFDVTSTRVTFYPDSLRSIRVFEGSPPTFNWANDHLDSTARLLNIQCGASCFSSPQEKAALFRCVGCKPFVSGQTYTAFLQRGARSTDDDFVRLVFVAP